MSGASEKTQQSRRRLARQVEELDLLVLTPLASSCHTLAHPAPSISAWPAAAAGPTSGASATAASNPLDWPRLPGSCDPASAIRAGASSRPDADSEKQAARAHRKRLQVESFAIPLCSLLGPPPGRRPLRVVDFGSGTGNLLLPLAAAWPACEWVAVEMKPQPLRILQQRADEAGLTNVRVCQVTPRTRAFAAEPPRAVLPAAHVVRSGATSCHARGLNQIGNSTVTNAI
jgi:hypothetical protein